MQTAVATQGEQQPPFGVRASIEHGLYLPASYEAMTTGVAFDRGFQLHKRVCQKEPFAETRTEKTAWR